MDFQTGLVYVGIVVLSAAAIAFISMFGIKEKSYEEAIAEQRKFPDDLLSSTSKVSICAIVPVKSNFHFDELLWPMMWSNIIKKDEIISLIIANTIILMYIRSFETEYKLKINKIETYKLIKY